MLPAASFHPTGVWVPYRINVESCENKLGSISCKLGCRAHRIHLRATSFAGGREAVDLAPGFRRTGWPDSGTGSTVGGRGWGWLSQREGNSQPEEAIDAEWLSLLLQARDLGITVQEIRDFLRSASHSDCREHTP
ncbi:MAG: anti-repressor SinI family protein [Alicyclobacillus macrosporangiidus]|uniref:anti-repressor SinI family protein n=1 Tax=Alicyclobacillus macrosporangiidus TaxID=392015 RepID=UPI0026E95F4C|nr:anti-repressor SinI family protein [Alicyclobacillus macrosporangiidus]MCL6597678.1 anti-repressor SinI family protein [Alicyclobacillus macrosporangiidus]